MDEDNHLECLTNKFDVFTKCGSLTPLQMCALFQFFRQTPMYKTSCFHQQYDNFYASKSNKTLANPIDHDDEDKFDTPHVKNSIE